jgi:hypothetical protein
MSDRPEVTVEMLVEHWRRQVQKLREAGIPLERLSDSMRTVALEVEQAWFHSLLDKAGERLAAIGPHATGYRKDDTPATPNAEGVTVMTDRIVIQVDGEEYDGTYEVTGGVVTVRTAYGSQSTQVVGDTPPEVLAKMLLGELVREGKARPDPTI